MSVKGKVNWRVLCYRTAKEEPSKKPCIARPMPPNVPSNSSLPDVTTHTTVRIKMHSSIYLTADK